MELKVVITVSDIEEVQNAITKVINLKKYAEIEKDHLICELVFVGESVHLTVKNSKGFENELKEKIIDLNINLAICKNAMAARGYVEEDIDKNFIPVNSGFGEAVKKQMLGYAYFKL